MKRNKEQQKLKSRLEPIQKSIRLKLDVAKCDIPIPKKAGRACWYSHCPPKFYYLHLLVSPFLQYVSMQRQECFHCLLITYFKSKFSENVHSIGTSTMK